MKTLTIALLTGMLALGQARPERETKYVVPVERVERSGSARESAGSYTFLFMENGRVACAYRTGLNIPKTTNNVNRLLEFEAARWNYAMRTNSPLGFTAFGRTAEGCYIIEKMVWK